MSRSAAPVAAPCAAPGVLPETAGVHWRPRADPLRIRRRGQVWTATTVGHTIPFLAVAVVLLLLEPLSFPVAAMALAHAWMIPELYAARGAGVLRPRRRAEDGPESVALGLLGDLIGHDAREVHARTGLVPERGRFGVWLVGEAGAILLPGRGRRAFCWCVRADAADLPSADKIAHLLLALREDEAGFATVANLTFSGATWRVKRRVRPAMRPGIDAARALARAASPGPLAVPRAA
jgi:hypothetical protein